MSVPYDVENIIAGRERMGLITLATDHVIEHELNKLFNRVEGFQLYTTKVSMVPNVTADTLRLWMKNYTKQLKHYCQETSSV